LTTNKGASVRIQIWNAPTSPAYDSGWSDMSSYGDAFRSYHAFSNRLETPERVQVVVKGTGDMNGFMFPASGSSSGSDERKFKEYGGILYRYNNNHVQVYAPVCSNIEKMKM